MKNITKVLAAQEDMFIGVGKINQERGAETVEVTKCELMWIFRTNDEIRALDINKYTRIALHQSGSALEYYYNGNSSLPDDDFNVLQPDSQPVTGRWLLAVGGGAGGEFVSRAGDSMLGPLVMYNRSHTLWYEDTGDTARIHNFIDSEGGAERAGINLYDIDGNDGDDEELVSIRTETTDGVIMRAATIVQRNIGTPTSVLDFAGSIGFNNIRENQDNAQFLIQGENGDRRAWFGTRKGNGGVVVPVDAPGLNAVQLAIWRPASDSTVPYIEFGVLADTPIFTVGPDGSVDIPTGAEFRINGVPVSGGGGGVGEAPIDGQGYVRQDAGWTLEGGGGGNFLPVDGSLPFTGASSSLKLINNSNMIQYHDNEITPRIINYLTLADAQDEKVAGIAIYDATGDVTDGNEAVSILSQKHNITGDVAQQMILRRDLDDTDYYTAAIGFTNTEKDSGYVQFLIGGTAADYPDFGERRRAWFGSQWANTLNPDAEGLNNIQLYINRPAEGTTGFINFLVDDEQRFTVTKGGGVTAGGGVYANGTGGTPSAVAGFAVWIEAHQDTDLARISAYDGPSDLYKTLELRADELVFSTTPTGTNVVTDNMKIWQNPDTPTEDEIAIFNKAQLRIYTDAGGVTRAFETTGSGSTHNGFRSINPLTNLAGVRADSFIDGTNQIKLHAPDGGDSITITGDDPGAALIAVDGSVSLTQDLFCGRGIQVTGVNGIDMNNNPVFDLRNPTLAGEAARKSYVDGLVSDMRVKTWLGSIDDALDNVLCLDTFRFSYDTDLPIKRAWHEERYGLSAQDVQKFFPDAVHHSALDRADDGSSISGDTILGVDYEGMIPILVRAIQDLNAKLEVLTNA